MNELMLAGVLLIYALLIYLIAIWRGGQSLLSWGIVYAVQAGSLFLCRFMKGYFRGAEFWAGSWYIGIALLILLNTALIFALNNRLFGREKPEEEGLLSTVSDLPEEEAKDVHEAAGKMPGEETPAAQPGGDPAAAETFRFIEELISADQKEKAVQYLRLLAFYGTDKNDIEKAKNMLQSLQ